MKEINLHDVFKDIESINEDGSSKCYTGFYLEQYDIDNKPELLAKIITMNPKVKIVKNEELRIDLTFPSEDSGDLKDIIQMLNVWEFCNKEPETEDMIYFLKVILTTDKYIDINIQGFMPYYWSQVSVYPKVEKDTLSLYFKKNMYKVVCNKDIKIIDNGNYPF